MSGYALFDPTTAVITELIESCRDEREEGEKVNDDLLVPLVECLTALKVALESTCLITGANLENGYHSQIQKSLELAVACCQALVDKLHTLDNDSEREEDQKAELSGSWSSKAISAEDSTRTVLKLAKAVEQLCSAASLKTRAEQVSWLRRRETQLLLEWIREQYAILSADRDLSASWIAPVYYKVSGIGSLVLRCKAFWENIYATNVLDPMAQRVQDYRARRRSRIIDKELLTYSVESRTELKALVLGACDYSSSLLRTIDVANGTGRDITLDELKGTIADRIKVITGEIAAFDAPGKNIALETKSSAQAVLDYLLQSNGTLHESVSNIFAELWDSPSFQIDGWKSTFFGIPLPMDVVLSNLGRIWKPGYVLTPADRIFVLQHRQKGTLTKWHMSTLRTDDGCSMTLLDGTARCHSYSKKVRASFMDLPALVFVVNLANYNVTLVEDESRTWLQEALAFFESLVKSPWFHRSAYVLLLAGITEFRAKLPHRPLSKTFPHYQGAAGDDDADAAAKYILDRFLALNVDKRKIYHHFCELHDPGTLASFLVGTAKDILLNNAPDSKAGITGVNADWQGRCRQVIRQDFEKKYKLR